MKKLCVIAFVLTLGCTLQTKFKSEPENKSLIEDHYSWEDQEIEGMTYRVYFKKHLSIQTGYSIFVVNITKDKLEVEKLRRENDNTPF